MKNIHKTLCLNLLFSALISPCKAITNKTLSFVEQQFLQKSTRQSEYPSEHIPVIEVSNVHELGKLTTLRFIEWVINNPTGVIALPTGKTPEYFIKYLKFYKKYWQRDDVQQELNRYGITNTHFPDTSTLKFVQLDEFYPINPTHYVSFTRYVKRYYLDFLGIKTENQLLIDTSSIGIFKEHGSEAIFPEGKVDLSLLTRSPHNNFEKRQQQALQQAEHFCSEYEKKIAAWGGIGFF